MGDNSKKSKEVFCTILKHVSLVKFRPLILWQYFVSRHPNDNFLTGRLSCASLNSLETDSIPRQELERHLQTFFEGMQLVNVTAEASISVVISRTKFLQADTTQTPVTLKARHQKPKLNDSGEACVYLKNFVALLRQWAGRTGVVAVVLFSRHQRGLVALTIPNTVVGLHLGNRSAGYQPFFKKPDTVTTR